MEQELLEIVERTLEKSLPVKEGAALLIVMYDAATREELDQAVHLAANAALENGGLDCYVADTPERAAAVWSVRGSILEAMKLDSVSQEECDVVVPRSEIAQYVKQAKHIAQRHGLRVEPCGHCGDGNIHTELLRGPEQSDEEWHTATRAALTGALRPGQDPGRADVRRARHRQRAAGLLKGICGGSDDPPVQGRQAGL